MLKMYRVGFAVKIDNDDWKAIDTWPCYKLMDENDVNNPKFTEYDCSSLKEWKDNICLIAGKTSFDAVYYGETFFKKRPYLSIRYRKDPNRPVKYFAGDFQHIAFCPIYVEIEHPTLGYIMKYSDAEKAIEYFKERGMNMCPIMKD